MNVSILITVYNCERFIGRAIRSCLDQNMPKSDYEIIVVDDGSTDRTPAIIDAFANYSKLPFIRVIKLEENKGIGYACNEGIKASLGQFIVRVDADDYISEDLLTIECQFLSMNRDMDAVACDYYIVNERGNVQERVRMNERPLACGIMFRKDTLLDIGLYDPEFRLLEDEDLLIRYLKEHGIYCIPLPLYRYYRHSENATLDKSAMGSYTQKLEAKHDWLREHPLS